MKLKNKNEVRAKFVAQVISIFEGEDVGMIASNSFNLPIVAEDGEEGWLEIVVKVPNDEGDDGYAKREEYAMKCADRLEKAKEKAEAKAKKIARDKKLREAKAKAKEKERK